MPKRQSSRSRGKNTNYTLCLKADNYFIDELVQADQSNQTDIVIRIPKSDRQDEFTFYDGIGHWVSHTLYCHGVISSEINVTMEYDETLNDEFLNAD